MRIAKRIVLGLFLALVLGVAGLTVFVATHQNPKADAPLPAIVASRDPAVLARGRHIAFDLGNCAYCHGDPSRRSDADRGVEIPLSGGRKEQAGPIGTFYMPNLTPDVETGLGAWSDAEIARSLRHMVKKDGSVMVPFMEVQHMSDEDLTAIVSYLKSVPPVRNAVPRHSWKTLGKVIVALMFRKPTGPTREIPKSVPAGPTVEYGKYLAESLVRCDACHTKRSKMTGEYLGAPFAGGDPVGYEENPGGAPFVFSTPNLTSDPATGRLAKFSEEAFVTRFHAGRLIPRSPMPWPAFARMQDDEIRAIYRFLMSLPPVVNETGVSFDPTRK